mmetsp:Transcript_5676/g.10836  ORF Transcript_5676/g.10836 Transcript_5676/m.10836 type:complete len:159 (-) Transcript_5676:466-942(-)|eukprot:CAMPEP_0114249590 /NCGR_PEP_ID=MMETSP0058-20121206/14226_1 /TAXON_ID=36894 /ORGANISM="Pyramimonas parkeae, CCMP726" /LENGTH=158 /DNA_ID=CAMNT_0001363151 /DNA_START=310 /DNA_END=786 /DNA_ORIENTATION=-
MSPTYTWSLCVFFLQLVGRGETADKLDTATIKGVFKRTSNDTAEYSVPDVTVSGLQEFFKEADQDNDGLLRFAEYRDLMLQFYLEDEEIREALNEPRASQLLFFSIDTDNNGGISYKELEVAMVEWFHDEEDPESESFVTHEDSNKGCPAATVDRYTF